MHKKPTPPGTQLQLPPSHVSLILCIRLRAVSSSHYFDTFGVMRSPRATGKKAGPEFDCIPVTQSLWPFLLTFYKFQVVYRGDPQGLTSPTYSPLLNSPWNEAGLFNSTAVFRFVLALLLYQQNGSTA